ncbi:hypothetical protein ACPWR0_14590 [Pandoraea pneumonica]|uniref:hypothetical protein n=1 Tax=Pandoraea pneumonica TaxID=2508299 RepID=UPI003CEC37ED
MYAEEGQVLAGGLQPVWGGWHCNFAQGLVLLKANSLPVPSAAMPHRENNVTERGFTPLASDVARAFQTETGYATSAIALTDAPDTKLKLTRFLAADGSAAAVLVIDSDELSRLWLTCDWKTPLLRVRNRLADEGSRLFVALTARGGAASTLSHPTNLWRHLVARLVLRFCNQEGIGFLGSVPVTTRATPARPNDQPDWQVAAHVAHRLASAQFFCCNAFRITT